MNIDEEEYFAHYGTPRHSGRYPWGSGDNEEGPRNPTFLDLVAELKSQGLTDTQVAQGMNISTTQFRAKRSIFNAERKQAEISFAQRLRDKGTSLNAIGERMGRGESYVRSLLAPGAKEKSEAHAKISEILKQEVKTKGMIDVGTGVESHAPLNISPQKLNVALAMLQEEGYKVHTVPMPQVSGSHDTRMKVLALPGTTQREVFDNRLNIKSIPVFTSDGGKTYGRVDHDPISVDPNRIQVKYKEDGGDKVDGVIFVRPNIEDISLGKNLYAQVRVLVNGTHYLKGMAVYKNDLPKGTDLVFHTSKSKSEVNTKLDAMKPIAEDRDYPFGSIVRQIVENEGLPNERNTSAMNIVNEQGDWAKWNKTLSSQMLSKQSPTLAKQQLDVTYERRKQEYDEINALTNPTVKKKLLETFANQADSAAEHLKAAALPSSNWHAILPIESMPPTQVYAPNYNNGERVVLLRYPHGGTFEIPDLIVNNQNPEAKKLLGESRDAIGIHHTVAKRLSGADFDGDTVLVIPNSSSKIKHAPALKELKNFDPQMYKLPEDSPIPNIGKRKQQEMGKISNLITDMTLKGADHGKVARAIKHSMVVIDAEKHNLNYKQSALDNGIAALKKEYQGKTTAGAATLISRKKSFDVVPHRKPRPYKDGGPIDRITGRKVFVETGSKKRDKQGNLQLKTSRVNRLSETPDAHTLVSSPSGTRMEALYADHSNKLKALANDARRKLINTPLLKYNSDAAKAYAKEVASLNAKLKLVIMNRPRERQAQVIAQAAIKAKKAANPNLERDQFKKIKWEEQERARQRMGAKKQDIKFTTDEWNAIQAGAISDNRLKQMLDKADMENVRSLATPRQVVLMTSAKTLRAKAMLASGYTRAAVAEQLGVSLTTLDVATNA